MVRRLMAGALVVSALLFVIPSTAVAAVQSTALPAGARQCLRGGWRNLTDAQGVPFGTQGQCVGFMVQHPVTLADLAGSFVGGTGSGVQNGDGCSNGVLDFLFTFHTTYSGSAAVGTVALHLEGCADFSLDTFRAGSFTLSTNAGSVSGTATGSVIATVDQNLNITVDLALTFIVTSGTGAFSTMTGALMFASHEPPGGPIRGTVTA